jgi:hypothetical protein
MAPKQLKYLVVAMDIIYQVGRSKKKREKIHLSLIATSFAKDL